MKRNSWLLVTLTFSILLNIGFAWGLFHKINPTPNVAVSYASSVKVMSQAHAILKQSNNEKDKRMKSRYLYQTLNYLTNVRFYMKDYEPFFTNQGIPIGNLMTVINDDWYAVNLEVGNNIEGKEVDQESLAKVDNDLKSITENLPTDYPASNIGSLKESFNKIRHIQ